MGRKVLLGIICMVLAALVKVPTASAAWVGANVANPGAESGTLTGWSTWSNRFIAVNDPTAAYEGNWYFFSRASRTTNNGVSFDQTVDLSVYTGSILNVDITAAYRYQSGQRWGYDADTNQSYLYDWVADLQMNAYSSSGHLFGIGFELTPSDTWRTETIPCNLRIDWTSARDLLTSVNIMGKAMYMPVDSGSPGSWAIESWGDWVGPEPTFVGFDSFEVSVETSAVPLPPSALLLLSALLPVGWIKLRRSR